LTYIPLFVECQVIRVRIGKKMSQTPLTPAQCRAARGLLGWNQGDLAREAGVSRETIIGFESGKREPIANNLVEIVMALLSAGIQPLYDEPGDAFSNGGGRGVRFSRPEGEASNPLTAVHLKTMRDVKNA
jgi:DNA-binding XRE family transcriptional regulator